MRVLVIEDNEELALAVKDGLEGMGFYIDLAYTGVIGEEKVFVNEYDCILLDLNLPDSDGLEILKKWREEGKDWPVIIITAKDEIKERVFGLDAGADDYLIKPFHLTELRARIQVAIRRYNGKSNPILVIGDLAINPMTREVSYAGRYVGLLAKEFDILEYLAEKHPSIVSAEEIVEHVYDENFDSFSSVLRVHISRLRKKLKEASGQDIIATMRGKGYFLCENSISK